MLQNQYSPVAVPPPGALQNWQSDPVELTRGGVSLRDCLHILRKRKRWLIGVMLGVVLLTVAVVFLMTPIYRATVLLQITQDSPLGQSNEFDLLSALKGGQELTKFQETQVKILESRSLAWRIIEALNLKDHEDFKYLGESDPPPSPEKLKEDLLDLFQKKLDIKPVKDSYLVEVAFKASDQTLAQKVANAVAREYIQLAIDRRSESFSLVKEWLEKQLQQLAGRVQDSQQKLYEFGQKSGFFALEDKDNVIIQKYIELNGLLTKAQSERLAKEAQYRQIEEKGAESPLITNNPLIMALRQELVAQTAKDARLRKIYLPGHPEMQAEAAKLQELRARLQNEVRRLQDAIKADFEAARRTEILLSEAYEAQKDRMVHLQRDLIDFQILKRDAQTTEHLYQALLARMKETTIASTMVASNVAVIDPADLPAEPYLPKKGLFLGLSGVIGLFLGLGAAFLAEYLDDSLKTTEEVERVCQLPSLGVVPSVSAEKASGRFLPSASRWAQLIPLIPNRVNDLSGNGEGAGLLLLEKPRSIVSEAIRNIRTSLLLSAPGRPPRAVLFTSPNPQEGKSTLASNLAVSLALVGRKVVLLDGDLRRPKLHRVFQTSAQPGLTTFLTGSVDWEGVIQPTQVPNLWLIPSGPLPPNPVELLNSEAFKGLVEKLCQDYQHVLIDAPPALGFADARVISPLVDGVVVIIKHNSTPREAGRLTCRLSTEIHASVLGVILNQVNTNGRRDEYYYHPKYYSGYFAEEEDGLPGKDDAGKTPAEFQGY
uniref:non-specific protein-tyrosine kinase n=1 Tax=Desulfobacca acetoxidans TaxID=60893 RepID=A0A7C3WSP3_9BACT